jgi:hypothetical protein
LHGAFGVVDHFQQPVDVGKYQVPTLICGHPSCEPDS